MKEQIWIFENSNPSFLFPLLLVTFFPSHTCLDLEKKKKIKIYNSSWKLYFMRHCENFRYRGCLVGAVANPSSSSRDKSPEAMGLGTCWRVASWRGRSERLVDSMLKQIYLVLLSHAALRVYICMIKFLVFGSQLCPFSLLSRAMFRIVTGKASKK